MNTASIKAKRARLVSSARESVDRAIREQRPMRVSEEIDFDGIIEKIEAIDRTLGRHASLSAQDNDGATGMTFVRCLRSLADHRGDLQRSVEYANSQGWQGTARALSASVATGGGYAVPSDLSAEFVEFLRPRVVLRKLGAPTAPLVHGNLLIPKIEYGATVSYVHEGAVINASAAYSGLVQGLPTLPNALYPSGTIVRNVLDGGLYLNNAGTWTTVGADPQFGALSLSVKKVAAIVVISNTLSRSTGGRADEIVKADLSAALGVSEDYFFLRGDGTGDTPLGLRYLAPAANVIASTGSTVANIDADLASMENVLLAGNCRMIAPAWIMSTRTETALRTLRNATSGVRAYPEMDRGMLRGKPFASTNSIPTNLGGGSLSEMYLVDVDDLRIGDGRLIIDAAKSGSYVDVNGNTISAFSQDQTAIRVIEETDIALRHRASLAVMTGVAY